jgi:hypothetical protein
MGVDTDTTNQSQSSWDWSDWIKVGVPGLFSVATLIVGAWIHNDQAKLQKVVDANQTVLQSQLAVQSALKEEFYKRRLTAYEKACTELAAVEDALNKAGSTDTKDETAAIDVIARFGQLNKGNTLYWSHGLQNGLDGFWTLGITKLRRKNWDDPQLNRMIDESLIALHEQMKTDLNVADLETILRQSK